MDGYTVFAPYYDVFSFDEFSKHCILYLDQLLSAVGFKGKNKVLDLACGTGTAAILLAKQGYQVTGIDISAPMLKIARNKAEKKNLRIKFICQDIRQMKFNQKFDLVTCFFDAMNHLYTYRDFAQGCRNVGKAMKPGGVFIFDLNTELGLKTLWKNQRTEQRKKNLRSIFISSYLEKKKLATVNATLYIKQGDKVKKIITRFANRAYTAEQVHRALRNAGLTLVADYDCFTLVPPSKSSSRIMYIARKK